MGRGLEAGRLPPGSQRPATLEAIALRSRSKLTEWRAAIEHGGMGFNINRLLTVAILAISIAPLYAQGQQPDTAKLKADAQKVVSIISSDKTKTDTFCQMVIVGKQVDEAIQEKDNTKAMELAQKLTELEKNLGSEYLALVESLRSMDLTSKDGQDIIATFDKLDESCPH